MGSQPRYPSLIQLGLDIKAPQSKILRQLPRRAHLPPAIRAILPFKILRVPSLATAPTLPTSLSFRQQKEIRARSSSGGGGEQRAQPGPPAPGAGSAPRLLVACTGRGGTRSQKLGVVRCRAARGADRGRGLGREGRGEARGHFTAEEMKNSFLFLFVVLVPVTLRDLSLIPLPSLSPPPPSLSPSVT